MIVTRRRFITSLATGLLVAPSIVRASSLMPVRAPRLSAEEWFIRSLQAGIEVTHRQIEGNLLGQTGGLMQSMLQNKWIIGAQVLDRELPSL